MSDDNCHVENKVDRLIDAWLEFDIHLLQGNGIDYKYLNEIKGLLVDLKFELANYLTVPKNLANLFLDIHVAISTSSERYPKEEQQTVVNVANELVGLAKDICL